MKEGIAVKNLGKISKLIIVRSSSDLQSGLMLMTVCNYVSQSKRITHRNLFFNVKLWYLSAPHSHELRKYHINH